MAHPFIPFTTEEVWQGLRDRKAGESLMLTEIPAPNEDMKGKVIDQVEKGYFMHDKIIRYAKVVVGK